MHAVFDHSSSDQTPYRFKVFADYEDYIKCQEKVSALYKASEVTYYRLTPMSYVHFLSFYCNSNLLHQTETQGMDQEGDLQHRCFWQVLQ